MSAVNPLRGDVALRVGAVDYRLRPSFAALVAAEAEIGSLIALAERAAGGVVTVTEIVALLWACVDPKPEGLVREAFAEAAVAGGLAGLTPAFRALLTVALGGTGGA